GAANLTVAHIVARAGISRRTFYEIFEDREACLLAALDDAVVRAAAVLVPAYEGETKWRERIRAALAALLVFLDEEPALGRLCVIEALGAGGRALELRARYMKVLVAAVDAGRAQAVKGRQPPPLTAEGVVGAVFSIVHTRMLAIGARDEVRRDEVRRNDARRAARRDAREAEPLSALLGPLMGVIVLPYLGQAAAQKELDVPVPVCAPKHSPRRDPFAGLDMRLTYRTIRVLMAAAEHPGASNRVVAEDSGITDQGQISKLLARLEGLGLILNSARGHAKGEPNAWELTARGREVERAMQLQAAPRRTIPNRRRGRT
ncbi:MAG TPA: TetR/AcrR family transcriptional regulator, partial [Solirubrobacteraceae bacterium]